MHKIIEDYGALISIFLSVSAAYAIIRRSLTKRMDVIEKNLDSKLSKTEFENYMEGHSKIHEIDRANMSHMIERIDKIYDHLIGD